MHFNTVRLLSLSLNFSVHTFTSCTHRERRTEFEEFLKNEKRKMEVFRVREVKEFLTLEEMKDKCDVTDEHMDMLEVSGCFLHINVPNYFFVNNINL